ERLAGGVAEVRRSIADVIADWPGGILCPVVENVTADGREISRHRPGRVIARLPGRRYHRPIHEQLINADGTTPPGIDVDDWGIRHLGYDPAQMVAHGKSERNRHLLARWVVQSPDDPDAWFYQDNGHRGDGRWPEALQAYRRAGLLQPSGLFGAHVLMQTLWVLAAMDMPGEVLRLGSANTALGTMTPDYWLLMGRAHLQQDHDLEAERCFQEARSRALAPVVIEEAAGASTWQPALGLAELAARRGDWAQAESWARQGLDGVPDDVHAQRLYVGALLMGGNQTKAIAHVRVARRGPDRVQAAMAQALGDLGEIAEPVLAALPE
ncbi:MAG: hypothetical protein H7338_21225, partial [Candidatus Sericytochromatia bacterium]|nr:hypothetical protein [Candidatus Sericytochromatia bacterium]